LLSSLLALLLCFKKERKKERKKRLEQWRTLSYSIRQKRPKITRKKEKAV
jgi:hypothetical protein